ncbi:MAG: Holliday junction resolvase RuvX [Anaerolineales bacterium]
MPRILAIDPGEARIGVAMTDPTGSIATPLTILAHSSRAADAAAIRDLADQHQVALILVGLPLDSEGRVGPQARRSLRLVEALRLVCAAPIETWDESGTTQLALRAGKRGEPEDARAAAFLLQDFVDSKTGWDTEAAAKIEHQP